MALDKESFLCVVTVKGVTSTLVALGLSQSVEVGFVEVDIVV